MVNYYSILGLSENASEEEIRKAYRAMAKQYHPDVNKAPDAHTIFLLINTAYEILIDKQQRIAYDNKRKATVDPFQKYTNWVQEQQLRQQEQAKRKHEEFLKKKKFLKESKMYYPYMVILYITTIVLITLSLLVLLICAVAIVWYHAFMFFFMLPFICIAAYVLKYTLDEYKKYKALFV